jgi:hypothetical protein
MHMEGTGVMVMSSEHADCAELLQVLTALLQPPQRTPNSHTLQCDTLDNALHEEQHSLRHAGRHTQLCTLCQRHLQAHCTCADLYRSTHADTLTVHKVQTQNMTYVAQH